MGLNEELEGAIDIVDLVSKYTTLKKAGANYKCTCPFPGHNEKTPSFIVSPTKQLAYCFGCHKGGGPIKFIMDIENCEYKEAIEILGSYTGIKVNTNFNTEKYEQKKSMYSLYRDIANYYKNALHNYPEIKKYLFERKLDEEIIRNFNIGFSDSGVELYSYLKEKGYEDSQIEDSKVFLDLKNKKDKFINRIIFPIQNARGDFIAFAGRVYKDGEPKYLNSPSSNYYDKSNILYNLFNARNTITKNDFVIVCEGYMDTIALYKGGYTNVVSISGTALTEKHLSLLKRLTKKIYLCFDGDLAGEKATKASIEKMKNKGLEVKIISLPSGKDPDEIISSGKDFGDYINKALSPIGYYIKKSKINNNSIDEKKKLLIELLEIIKSYSDNVEKDFYLKEISKLLEINENIVYDSFNRIKFSIESDNITKNNTKDSFLSSDFVIAYAILDNNYLNFFKEKIILQDILGNDLKEIFKNGIESINSFPLEKKEKYRGLSLKIETENEFVSEEKIKRELEKIALILNRETYKKEEKRLKLLINTGDNEALKKYSELLSYTKKYGLK